VWQSFCGLGRWWQVVGSAGTVSATVLVGRLTATGCVRCFRVHCGRIAHVASRVQKQDSVTSTSTATKLRCTSVHHDYAATWQRQTQLSQPPLHTTVKQRCMQDAKVGLHQQSWPGWVASTKLARSDSQHQQCTAYNTQAHTSNTSHDTHAQTKPTATIILLLLLLPCYAADSHAWPFV
jgi:hypothetical protein